MSDYKTICAIGIAALLLGCSNTSLNERAKKAQATFDPQQSQNTSETFTSGTNNRVPKKSINSASNSAVATAAVDDEISSNTAPSNATGATLSAVDEISSNTAPSNANTAAIASNEPSFFDSLLGAFPSLFLLDIYDTRQVDNFANASDQWDRLLNLVSSYPQYNSAQRLDRVLTPVFDISGKDIEISYDLGCYGTHGCWDGNGRGFANIVLAKDLLITQSVQYTFAGMNVYLGPNPGGEGLNAQLSYILPGSETSNEGIGAKPQHYRIRLQNNKLKLYRANILVGELDYTRDSFNQIGVYGMDLGFHNFKIQIL